MSNGRAYASVVVPLRDRQRRLNDISPGEERERGRPLHKNSSARLSLFQCKEAQCKTTKHNV